MNWSDLSMKDRASYIKLGIENGITDLDTIRKVSQFTLEGEYLRSFSSANEAEKFTSVSRGAILRCCKGKVKRVGNFIWRYYGKGI